MYSFLHESLLGRPALTRRSTLLCAAVGEAGLQPMTDTHCQSGRNPLGKGALLACSNPPSLPLCSGPSSFRKAIREFLTASGQAIPALVARLPLVLATLFPDWQPACSEIAQIFVFLTYNFLSVASLSSLHAALECKNEHLSSVLKVWSSKNFKMKIYIPLNHRSPLSQSVVI